MNRRDFYRYGTIALGGLVAPGAGRAGGRLPARPAAQARPEAGGLRDADPPEPARRWACRSRSPIIDERQDAWVKYPREPVGSVWLIRQPAGVEARGHRLHGRVPAPGLRGQPGGRRQELPLPLPHQRLRLRRASRQNQVPPRPMDRARRRAHGRRRPRGPRQVPAVPDPDRGEDPPCLTNSPTGSTTGPGYRALVHEALEEPIPGGARWRYVFGSALTHDLHDPGSSPACC